MMKAKASINAAKTKEKEKNIFFVWLQGESDAIIGNSKTYYKQKCRKLLFIVNERYRHK